MYFRHDSKDVVVLHRPAWTKRATKPGEVDVIHPATRVNLLEGKVNADGKTPLLTLAGKLTKNGKPYGFASWEK